MLKLHTITLNPAIDRILYLDEYKPEVTNRLTGSLDSLGGKGTHVSVDLGQMGVPNQAMGIVHGETGKQIIELLKQDYIDVKFQRYEEKNSRTNYLIIEDSGKCTCLSSRGIQLSKQDVEDFIEFMRPEIETGDYLIFSGDASNCPDSYVYNRIMNAFRDKNLKVFMDASGETLKKCIEEKPFLIKPNQDELSYLCGKELITIDEIRNAIEMLKDYEIPIIAVSLGKNGSLVCAYGKFYRVISPEVNINNTIGCGDCFLSGLIYGVYHELPIKETLRYAAAVSSACAESELSMGFDQKRAEELKDRVQIIEM